MTAGTQGNGDAETVLASLATTVRGSYSTVEDMTRAFIRAAIQRGIYRPGERLQQDAIAQLLGVSRMPVRASLRQLEIEGLVTTHPHRGASVASLSSEAIAELYELRAVVESWAIRRVVARISDDDLAVLEHDAEVMAPVDADPYQWLEARNDFYARLYRHVGTGITGEVILRLQTSVAPYLLIKQVLGESHGHQALIDLLRARDADGAAQWLQHHLEAVSAEFQRLALAERDGAPD